ncbi:hypothetical protein BDV97DRAFT_28166 [Delphinella strobiligena]|nr:hypothetical protein BDV97DRAFT_28166 [Delphinella strobiligena]
MTAPMNEDTLNSFDLTPAEMDTFAALRSFNADEEQQSQLPQQGQEQHQQHYVDDSQPGLYFDMIDPRLVSNAPTPMAPHMSPGSGSGLDPATSFISTTVTNEDKLTSVELGHFYPDPTTAGTAYSGTPSNNIGDSNPYGGSTQYDMGIGFANPLRHQLLGHRRSISVPPEEPGPVMVFTRAGTPLGESTNPSHPSTPGRLLKTTARKRKLESARHGAYGKRGRGSTGGGGDRGRYELRRSQTQPVRGGGPTSAPSPARYPPEMMGIEGERDDHSFHQSSRPVQPQPYSTAKWFGDPSVPSTASWSTPKQPDTFAEREKAWFERVDVRELLANGDSGGVSTAQIFVLARLDQLSRELDDLRVELRRGLLNLHHDDDEVERLRRSKRLYHATVTNLRDRLHALPLSTPDRWPEETQYPHSGQAVRDLDGDFLLSLSDTSH